MESLPQRCLLKEVTKQQVSLAEHQCKHLSFHSRTGFQGRWADTITPGRLQDNCNRRANNSDKVKRKPQNIREENQHRSLYREIRRLFHHADGSLVQNILQHAFLQVESSWIDLRRQKLPNGTVWSCASRAWPTSATQLGDPQGRFDLTDSRLPRGTAGPDPAQAWPEAGWRSTRPCTCAWASRTAASTALPLPARSQPICTGQRRAQHYPFASGGLCLHIIGLQGRREQPIWTRHCKPRYPAGCSGRHPPSSSGTSSRSARLQHPTQLLCRVNGRPDPSVSRKDSTHFHINCKKCFYEPFSIKRAEITLIKATTLNSAPRVSDQAIP